MYLNPIHFTASWPLPSDHVIPPTNKKIIIKKEREENNENLIMGSCNVTE